MYSFTLFCFHLGLLISVFGIVIGTATTIDLNIDLILKNTAGMEHGTIVYDSLSERSALF